MRKFVHVWLHCIILSTMYIELYVMPIKPMNVKRHTNIMTSLEVLNQIIDTISIVTGEFESWVYQRKNKYQCYFEEQFDG